MAESGAMSSPAAMAAEETPGKARQRIAQLTITVDNSSQTTFPTALELAVYPAKGCRDPFALNESGSD